MRCSREGSLNSVEELGQSCLSALNQIEKLGEVGEKGTPSLPIWLEGKPISSRGNFPARRSRHQLRAALPEADAQSGGHTATGALQSHAVKNWLRDSPG